MDQQLLNHDTVISYHPSGSRYICNPPVMDTDEDWVVLVKPEKYNEFQSDVIAQNGFYQSNRGYARTEFTTYRHIDANDKRNLIITFDPEWYQLFVEATEIAKDENLLRKEDRVALFELIMAKVRKKEERRYQKLKEQAEKNLQEYYLSTPSSKTSNKFYPWVSTPTATQTYWTNSTSSANGWLRSSGSR